MRNIKFIGSTDTNYFLGKGRGKDKKKRKSRLGYLIGAGTGAGLLGGVSAIRRGAPIKSALIGAGVGLLAGRTINKSIDKEKERFQEKGYRTRLGKVVTDAKTGTKTLGKVLIPITTLGAGAVGLRNGLMTGSLKGILTTGAITGLGGAAVGGLGSALIGGGIGAGSGIVRGFVQPNKKKRKKLRVNIKYD